MLTKKQKDGIRTFFYHLLVGGLCLAMIYPIVWMVASSLKGQEKYGQELLPSFLKCSRGKITALAGPGLAVLPSASI